MLKSLYPEIDWDSIQAVGFDMDGTLYDEADFIAQCYVPIADHLAAAGCGEASELRAAMFCRWMEKGSSYTRIFREILEYADVPNADLLEKQCVGIFRSFDPKLSLPSRVEALLDVFSERYPVFLVSDGSARLQRAKFEALGLNRWFDEDNVAISGMYGAGFQKPATGMIDKIKILSKKGLDSRAVVYFGDRDVDAGFACAAGFSHVRVNSLIPTMDNKRI